MTFSNFLRIPQPLQGSLWKLLSPLAPITSELESGKRSPPCSPLLLQHHGSSFQLQKLHYFEAQDTGCPSFQPPPLCTHDLSSCSSFPHLLLSSCLMMFNIHTGDLLNTLTSQFLTFVLQPVLCYNNLQNLQFRNLILCL